LQGEKASCIKYSAIVKGERERERARKREKERERERREKEGEVDNGRENVRIMLKNKCQPTRLVEREKEN
jgi:hypothetical protein